MRVDHPRSTIAHRALPVTEMLAEAARFEETLGAEDDIPVCIGALRDGRSIDAPSLAQLRADLEDVPDEDVMDLSIGIGGPATQIWLSREPDFSSSDPKVTTRLRVVGEDDAQADSVFRRVSQELDERLRAVEETERREAAERERELAAARREALEAAARSKPDTRFGRLAARATARAQREPETWELWAMGAAAAIVALILLIVATMLIH